MVLQCAKYPELSHLQIAKLHILRFRFLLLTMENGPFLYPLHKSTPIYIQNTVISKKPDQCTKLKNVGKMHEIFLNYVLKKVSAVYRLSYFSFRTSRKLKKLEGH